MAGLVTEYGQQEGNGGQGLFAAGEQQHVLQQFPRRLGNDFDSSVERILRVQQFHFAPSPAEQLPEAFPEVQVHGFEGFQKLLTGDLIDLADGGTGILDGIEEILTLPGKEVEPLFAFLEFLQGHHVHRAHGIQAIPELEGLRLQFPIASWLSLPAFST